MNIAPIYVPEPTYNDPLELAFLNRLRMVGEELVQEYIAANTRQGIFFLSRDAAKRIFPEYVQSPTINNRFADAAASTIADAVRRTLLSRPAHPTRNRILMLTGAPASGKTKSAFGPATIDDVEMEHETILTQFARSRDLIDQALAAGRFPILRLFYTDDPRINVQRMIGRARAIGRTVPLTYMAKAYLGVPALVEAVRDEFGLALTLLVTNNSETPAQAVHHNRIERALYHVNRYTEKTALEAMHGELNKIIAGPEGLSPAILEEALRT